MEASHGPEIPNEEGLAALTERAADGSPVVMLNLLSFEPDGGRARYEEYGAAVAPLLEKVGGRIVYVAEASPALLGKDSWDLVALVEYPTRQAFLDMVGRAIHRFLGAGYRTGGRLLDPLGALVDAVAGGRLGVLYLLVHCMLRKDFSVAQTRCNRRPFNWRGEKTR